MQAGTPEEKESLLSAEEKEEGEKEKEKGAEEVPVHESTRPEPKSTTSTSGVHSGGSSSTSTPPPAYARPPPHTKPPSKTKEMASGFLGFLTKVASDVQQELEIGMEKLGETIDKEIHTRNVEGERHFQEEFHFPPTEKLLGSYGCKVLNGDVGIAGTAYISENNFCFQGGALKILIPWQTVLKLQKALRVREHHQPHDRHHNEQEGAEGGRHPRSTHLFQPVPPSARGDCLQIYTNDHMIHHFFSDLFTFGPLHNMVLTFDSFFRLAEETWKFANAPRVSEEDNSSYVPQPDTAFWGQQQGQPAPQQPQQQQQPPQQQPSAFPPQQHTVPQDWQAPAPVFVFPVPQEPLIPQQQAPAQEPVDLLGQLSGLGPTPQEKPKDNSI